jgi:hypothetical protein
MRSHQQEIQSLRDTHQSELDQLRLEMERSDSNHQQERDRLQAEMDGLRNSNENLRAEKEQVHLSWNIGIHRVQGRATSRLCVCCRCHCRLLRFLWRPHGCIHIYFLLRYYEQTFLLSARVTLQCPWHMPLESSYCWRLCGHDMCYMWPISLIKFQAIMLVSLLSVASRGGAGNSESGRIKGGDPSCTRSQRSGIG